MRAPYTRSNDEVTGTFLARRFARPLKLIAPDVVKRLKTDLLSILKSLLNIGFTS